MLARCFEEAGISTTGIVFVKEHAARVKPPRMLWVPYFFGNTLGRANEPELQHRVLRATLDLLDYESGPVLEEFPDDTVPELLLQASEAAPSDQTREMNPADELTALRAYYERWVDNHGGRTNVGVCGVPQRRFRGVVRFLEGYVSGEQTESPERPDGTGVPQYIRYCVDDLKAFYYEARMEQRPQATDGEIHEWFWGETAMGQFIVKLAAHMNESDDADTKAIPYGLAR